MNVDKLKKGKYPKLNGMLSMGSLVLNKSDTYLPPTTKLKKKKFTFTPFSPCLEEVARITYYLLVRQHATI